MIPGYDWSRRNVCDKIGGVGPAFLKTAPVAPGGIDRNVFQIQLSKPGQSCLPPGWKVIYNFPL